MIFQLGAFWTNHLHGDSCPHISKDFGHGGSFSEKDRGFNHGFKVLGFIHPPFTGSPPSVGSTVLCPWESKAGPCF